MFRSFSTVIIIVCATKTVFASSKHQSSICGENEVLSQCVNRVCSYRKCSEVGGPVECIMMSKQHCKKGCICRDEYLRADNGTCILASQCPNALKCPKLNEYYDPCPPQCPSRTCAIMDNTTECPEPLQVGDPRCPPGSCRCNVGFYRHSNGNCVPWNLCNKCRENENLTSCFEGRCERRNCSDLGKPVACVRINPIFCTIGCLCQDGFLRADNGTCIPVDQCPEAQCGDNEDFDMCPPTCPGEQCGVDPSTVLCFPSPEPGDPSCQPSCRCRSGYLRNDNGTCIPQNQCRTECGANEVYDTCIAPSPRRSCGVDDSNNRCAEPPQPGDPACTAGCRCADNFFRNNEGNCVPKSECALLCVPNEDYSTCVQYQQQRCVGDSKVVSNPPNQECKVESNRPLDSLRQTYLL